MLTERQRARCAKLAAALDAGDPDGIYQRAARAEPGLSGEEKVEVWDQRAHVKEMYRRQRDVAARRPGVISTVQITSRIETRTDDLDFWAAPVDEGEDDGDDDDKEQTTKLCPVCRGKGRQKDGSQCEECDGSGRVPMDDVDDGDDDEMEKKGYRYEFEFEED